MDDGNILDGRQQDNIHDNHIHGHTEDNNDDNMGALIHHSFLSYSLQYRVCITIGKEPICKKNGRFAKLAHFPVQFIK
ncbi:hypothetical protein AN964_13040 [Heyndrickxia shackletonii]|uniref:Uncharacterized protein n=1 Tax=Heyndrickxia shackletonii TaxID=157838 RepID=A0A0Q3WYD9_9BACI|nr:hypothetical protein AN964_13040 [Heyndrickxia shackletonii]